MSAFNFCPAWRAPLATRRPSSAELRLTLAPNSRALSPTEAVLLAESG
jgi:hypothetical protein